MRFLDMLARAKGTFDLLQAWPDVLRAVPRAQLILAGAGAIDEARAAARRDGFERSLVTPGWVDEAMREKLLDQAWVVTLPSHWEAMPMAVLEAQAAGVPVVASRVGGLPLIVDDGRTGLLVPAGNGAALAQALVTLLRQRTAPCDGCSGAGAGRRPVLACCGAAPHRGAVVIGPAPHSSRPAGAGLSPA